MRTRRTRTRPSAPVAPVPVAPVAPVRTRRARTTRRTDAPVTTRRARAHRSRPSSPVLHPIATRPTGRARRTRSPTRCAPVAPVAPVASGRCRGAPDGPVRNSRYACRSGWSCRALRPCGASQARSLLPVRLLPSPREARSVPADLQRPPDPGLPGLPLVPQDPGSAGPAGPAGPTAPVAPVGPTAPGGQVTRRSFFAQALSRSFRSRNVSRSPVNSMQAVYVTDGFPCAPRAGPAPHAPTSTAEPSSSGNVHILRIRTSRTDPPRGFRGSLTQSRVTKSRAHASGVLIFDLRGRNPRWRFGRFEWSIYQ